MQKLNRKGFTLIELLAVVVILLVIMAIAIPTVTSTIERSKDKEKKEKINLIISSAETYTNNHKNTYNPSDEITLQKLFCDSLITRDEILDPFSDTKTLCGYVHYDSSQKKLIWQENNDTKYCLSETIDCSSIEK